MHNLERTMFETNLRIENSKLEKLKKWKIGSNYFQNFNLQKFFKKIEWEISWGQWKQRSHCYTGLIISHSKVADVKVTVDFWSEGASGIFDWLPVTLDSLSANFDLYGQFSYTDVF